MNHLHRDKESLRVPAERQRTGLPGCISQRFLIVITRCQIAGDGIIVPGVERYRYLWVLPGEGNFITFANGFFDIFGLPVGLDWRPQDKIFTLFVIQMDFDGAPCETGQRKTAGDPNSLFRL